MSPGSMFGKFMVIGLLEKNRSQIAFQYMEFRHGLGIGLMDGLLLCENHPFQGRDCGQDLFWQMGNPLISGHFLQGIEKVVSGDRC